MNIIKFYNLNKINRFTCYFSVCLYNDNYIQTVSNEFGNLRKYIQEDRIELNKLNFEEVKRLSEQVSDEFKNRRIEKSILDKYTNLLSDYVQKDSIEDKKLKLEDYFSLLDYNYLTLSDKYLCILTSNISSLLGDQFKDSEEVPYNEIDKVIRLLSKLYKLGIHNPKLFEFVSKYVKKLDNQLLCDFTNLSQKYGLRTKHFLDMCYQESLKRIDNLDLNVILNLFRSFSYSSFDYRDIFLNAVPKIVENVNLLPNEDVLMLLNVSKILNKYQQITDMRDQILKKLNEDIHVHSNEHLLRCLSELSKGKKTLQSKIFYSNVLDKIDDDDLKSLGINDLVNVLHTFNAYKKKMTFMTDILTVLSTRMNEIVSNRNLGLWAEIFDVINDTGWFSKPFMDAGITNIIMEPQVLCRVSTYQLVRVLQAFYKLRLYHKETYKILLGSINNGFDFLVPRFNMMSEALLASADANIEIEELYNKTFEFYEKQVEKLKLLELDEDLIDVMKKNFIWPRNVVTSAWSFGVMDYHRKDGYSKLLKLMVHPKFIEVDLDMNTILMALEVAENCLVDVVHMELAQEISEIYGDKMRYKEINKEEPMEFETLRDNKLPFNESQFIHFHKGRERATRHIYSILENLNKKDLLIKVSPHFNSPYIIDICFSKENKKGIVLFSGRELMRNNIDTTWSIIDTGSSKLKIKILQKQNWNIVLVSCSQWAVLNSGMERKDYVKGLLNQLDISY